MTETNELAARRIDDERSLDWLVTRLVDPQSGAIRLDGADLRDLAPGELAEHVALVPQSAFLFDDTVRDNITLGADISDEEVWEALRTAQADGFVAGLPHGLDSQLGERGTTLSGGEAQRIKLARATLRGRQGREPGLVILDEPVTGLHPQDAQRLMGTLDLLLERGNTVVVAEHGAVGRYRHDLEIGGLGQHLEAHALVGSGEQGGDPRAGGRREAVDRAAHDDGVGIDAGTAVDVGIEDLGGRSRTGQTRDERSRG